MGWGCSIARCIPTCIALGFGKKDKGIGYEPIPFRVLEGGSVLYGCLTGKGQPFQTRILPLWGYAPDEWSARSLAFSSSEEWHIPGSIDSSIQFVGFRTVKN